jgi:hypothetical protein
MVTALPYLKNSLHGDHHSGIAIPLHRCYARGCDLLLGQPQLTYGVKGAQKLSSPLVVPQYPVQDLAPSIS